jgi:hypothetical protein
MTEERTAQYFLLLELAADIISPEHYGHAVPPELVRRVARILKQLPADAQRQVSLKSGIEPCASCKTPPTASSNNERSSAATGSL